MPDANRHQGSRSKNLVGFLVGEVRYAIDILRVREIINPLPLVSLPHAPPVVVGVADHRGEVVPVVDLGLRFGLPRVELTRRTKWIVIGRGKQSVGLVVDAVTDVFGAGPDSQRSVPNLGDGSERRGIASVYAHDDALVFVVDADAIASVADGIDVVDLAGAMP